MVPCSWRKGGPMRVAGDRRQGGLRERDDPIRPQPVLSSQLQLVWPRRTQPNPPVPQARGPPTTSSAPACSTVAATAHRYQAAGRLRDRPTDRIGGPRRSVRDWAGTPTSLALLPFRQLACSGARHPSIQQTAHPRRRRSRRRRPPPSSRPRRGRPPCRQSAC